MTPRAADGRREPQPDGLQGAVRLREVGEQVLEQPASQRQPFLVGVVVVERPLLGGDDLPGEVADRDLDVGVAEVDAGHEPCLAGDAHRRTSAARAGGLLEETRRREDADDVGDRGRSQLGEPGDLGLAELVAGPDRIDDAVLVRRPQRRGRTRGRHEDTVTDRPIAVKTWRQNCWHDVFETICVHVLTTTV